MGSNAFEKLGELHLLRLHLFDKLLSQRCALKSIHRIPFPWNRVPGWP